MFKKAIIAIISGSLIVSFSASIYASPQLSSFPKKETTEKTFFPSPMKGTEIINGKVVLTEEKLLFLNQKAKEYKQKYGIFPFEKDAFWIYISDFTPLDEIPLKYEEFAIFRGCGYIAFSANTNNISIILEKNHIISYENYTEIIRSIGISPDVNLFLFKE